MPGILHHSPALVIWKALIDGGHGTDPDSNPDGDWPIFDNHHPDLPDDIVKISDTAGRAFGYTQPDSEYQEMYGLQIMIRAAIKDEGFQKANQIAIYLDRINYLRISLEQIGTDEQDDDYVIQCVDRVSSIIGPMLDQPGGKRNVFTINALATIRMCC